MLMWGIWQGKGKPPFNVYFEPFASEMMQSYEQGIVRNGSKTIDDQSLIDKVHVYTGNSRGTDLQVKSERLRETDQF